MTDTSFLSFPRQSVSPLVVVNINQIDGSCETLLTLMKQNAAVVDRLREDRVHHKILYYVFDFSNSNFLVHDHCAYDTEVDFS